MLCHYQVIYSRFGSETFSTSGLSSVIYHCTTPNLYDEVSFNLFLAIDVILSIDKNIASYTY